MHPVVDALDVPVESDELNEIPHIATVTHALTHGSMFDIVLYVNTRRVTTRHFGHTPKQCLRSRPVVEGGGVATSHEKLT